MLHKGSRPDPYGVTLQLYREARGCFAIVSPPHEYLNRVERPGRPSEPISALCHALALAKRHHCDVTVMDPDSCWRPAWGELQGCRSSESVSAPSKRRTASWTAGPSLRNPDEEGPSVLLSVRNRTRRT